MTSPFGWAAAASEDCLICAHNELRSWKRLGAEPFIVPAMGARRRDCDDRCSAGAAWRDEESAGCKIHSSMDVVQLARSTMGFRCCGQERYEADGIVVINR